MPRRRTFSPEFNAQRVLEVFTGAKTAAEGGGNEVSKLVNVPPSRTEL